MKALAQQYVPPTKELLQQAFKTGTLCWARKRVSVFPNGFKLVIHNYLKPEDAMTVIFDRQQPVKLTGRLLRQSMRWCWGGSYSLPSPQLMGLHRCLSSLVLVLTTIGYSWV